jgi:hypothetical protein
MRITASAGEKGLVEAETVDFGKGVGRLSLEEMDPVRDAGDIQAEMGETEQIPRM